MTRSLPIPRSVMSFSASGASRSGWTLTTSLLMMSLTLARGSLSFGTFCASVSVTTPTTQ